MALPMTISTKARMDRGLLLRHSSEPKLVQVTTCVSNVVREKYVSMQTHPCSRRVQNYKRGDTER